MAAQYKTQSGYTDLYGKIRGRSENPAFAESGSTGWYALNDSHVSAVPDGSYDIVIVHGDRTDPQDGDAEEAVGRIVIASGASKWIEDTINDKLNANFVTLVSSNTGNKTITNLGTPKNITIVNG